MFSRGYKLMNGFMRTIFSKTPLMVLAVAVLFAAAALRAQAAPGDLDQTFGMNGKVLTRFTNNSTTFGPRATPKAMVIQPDGKIIVAGQAMVSDTTGTTDAFALVRYQTNGSLDTGFGRSGRVTTKIGIQDAALAVALQPDGKIVAAGYANIGPAGALNLAFALVRYNANGSLDRSFDGDGKVVTDLTAYLDELTGVAIQPDGKIVAAGFINAGYSTDFAVARYNPNGSLDTSFGQGGIAQTDFFHGVDGGTEMVLLPDGKIVVAGSVYNSAGAGDFALVRYMADGTLDASFGNGGKVTTNFSGTSSDIVHDMDIAPNGKLVVAGGSGQPGKWDFAVARYNANGTLDRTFDGDGKFVRDISGFGTQDSASGVAVQQNGKIVVSGDASPFSNGNGGFDLVTIRLNVNGSLDLGFGNRGKVYTDFGSFRRTGGYSHDVLSDVKIQRDGKIVVTGDAELEPNRTHDIVLARYLGDPVRLTQGAVDVNGDLE
jgi:uncharacterized delta-60 repeat protein